MAVSSASTEANLACSIAKAIEIKDSAEAACQPPSCICKQTGIYQTGSRIHGKQQPPAERRNIKCQCSGLISDVGSAWCPAAHQSAEAPLAGRAIRQPFYKVVA